MIRCQADSPFELATPICNKPAIAGTSSVVMLEGAKRCAEGVNSSLPAILTGECAVVLQRGLEVGER